MTNAPQPAEQAQPTPLELLIRRRWLILGVIFLVTVINFIDRQTLSVLAPVIRQQFHLTNTQYGRIVSAFMFGMLSGELPMGLLMDRWGVRIGLSFAVLWWSGATGAQVFAKNGTQFGLFRYWMGTGECATTPAASKPSPASSPARTARSPSASSTAAA